MKLTFKQQIGAWVKYNEKGMIEYVLKVDAGKINEIYAPDGNVPDTIILPEINEDGCYYIDNEQALQIRKDYESDAVTLAEKIKMDYYISGYYYVTNLSALTEQHKTCKIIIPVKSSIALYPFCFPSNTPVVVELVLPEDMTIKYAYWQNDKDASEGEYYLLVTHKDFNSKVTYSNGLSLIVEDYEKHAKVVKGAEKGGEIMYSNILGFPNIVISKDKLVEKDGAFEYKTAEELQAEKAQNPDSVNSRKK